MVTFKKNTLYKSISFELYRFFLKKDLTIVFLCGKRRKEVKFCDFWRVGESTGTYEKIGV